MPGLPPLRLGLRSPSRAWLGALAAIVLCQAAATALAQEWTRFRGPNGTGISPARGIPLPWTAAQVAWQAELPGAGHSSPVIWGDRVFLTSAEGDGAERIVLSLDTADGRIVWARRYPGSVHTKHNLNSFASPTPCVDADRVYVSWSSPESYLVLALDHAGGELWRCDLGPYVSQHSAGPSPVIYEDLLIVGNDQDGESSLVALDRASGQVVWRTARRADKVAYSTPCVLERSGQPNELVFLSGSHGVSGVDPRSGQTRWELPVFDKRTVSSPVLGAGLIFGTCGSGAGGNFVVAVKPGTVEGAAAELAFKVEKSAPYVPTPLARGDRLYLWSDQGVASCLEIPSGNMLWQRRVGGNFFGSPILLEERLICLSSDGEAVILAAADEYELLGRVALGELSHSTPAVSGGRLFLRTQSRLIAVADETP